MPGKSRFGVTCLFSHFLNYIPFTNRSFVLVVCVFAHVTVRGGVVSAFEPEIPGYVHDAWTVEQGLPKNTVSTLVVSRTGYLWGGSNTGLYRFDGVTFTVFTVTNTPALRSNWIAGLYESPDGTLWIGTSKGVVRYRDGVFTREDGPLSDDLIHVFCEAGDGRLLAASPERLYQRDANGRWTVAPLEVRAGQISTMTRDSRGSIWIAWNRHVVEWRGRVERTFTVRDGLPDAPVRALREEPGGGVLWIGTERGLARVDLSTGAIALETGPLERIHVTRLFFDRDGLLWIGSIDRLATRSATGDVALHTIAPIGSDTGISELQQDAAGQIWFGSQGASGGLHRLTRRRVASYTRADGLPCDNIASIAEGPEGAIWFGAFCPDGGALAVLEDGRLRTYADTGMVRFISALLPWDDGSVLIGTTGRGVVRFANGQFTPLKGPFRDYQTDITALYRDRDGALWVGMDEGLARHHEGAWRVWREKDGLPSSHVRTIVGGRDGALWIGTAAGVTHYREGRFTSYGDADGIPHGEVRALYVDSDHALWIGTYGGGLARMKDGRVTRYGTYGGLLDDSVHAIVEDDRGDFWLSGDHGIRRVSRRELTAIAEGRTGSPRVETFDTADGMTNAECNGMGQPGGLRTRDGRLLFTCQQGLVRVDASAAPADAPSPAAAIVSVRVNGIEQPEPRAIIVPPGARDLEIHYSAPALVRPVQMQFKYRLLGNDEDDWIEVGARRFAHFGSLRPGMYQFQVAARSAAGDWHAVPTTLRLVLEPRLYERVSFRVAMGGVLLLVLGAGMTLRQRRLERRAQTLEAVVAERTRELRAEREVLQASKAALEEARAALEASKAAVEASHARLLATFNQLRVGVVLVDAEGRVRFLSEAMQPLMGDKPLEDLIGQPLERVLPIAQESLAAIRAHVRTPRRGVRITAEFAPTPDQRFWTEIEVHLHVSDPQQRVLHLYDVTETFVLKRTLGTAAPGAGTELLGESVGMRNLRAEIATVAVLDATVLIEGETGTGKELVARAIHTASRRKDRPFVAINCAGLTESLLASQLFGHRRGAFTGAISDHIGLFEAAQGGTLLLDEIGDMPMGVQTHLLRVLEEREILRLGDSKPRPIDVRLLAATHRDLDADVKAGRFREDLLYRIRVVRLRLPPLRSRTGDIPLVAATFLRRATEAHGLSVASISREAMEHLTAQRWPGNVRQLKAAIEGAAIRASGPVLKLGDVLAESPSDVVPSPRSGLPDQERDQLIAALQQTSGNRAAAARLLGWPRSTFYHRLSRLQAEGLDLPGDTSTLWSND